MKILIQVSDSMPDCIYAELASLGTLPTYLGGIWLCADSCDCRRFLFLQLANMSN